MIHTYYPYGSTNGRLIEDYWYGLVGVVLTLPGLIAVNLGLGLGDKPLEF